LLKALQGIAWYFHHLVLMGAKLAAWQACLRLAIIIKWMQQF
jgi:hypothetical protein